MPKDIYIAAIHARDAADALLEAHMLASFSAHEAEGVQQAGAIWANSRLVNAKKWLAEALANLNDGTAS